MKKKVMIGFGILCLIVAWNIYRSIKYEFVEKGSYANRKIREHQMHGILISIDVDHGAYVLIRYI